MGSRKKSKNNSTSTNAAQMAALQRANPSATMGQMMGAQKGMQNTQMKDIMGAFNQMKQAGDSQMAQNPMQAVMAEMMGMGQMSDNDVASAMEMFDMSRFEPQEPAPQQMPPVSPFMHGQYITNQGMANPSSPRYRGSTSLYDQMMGNPYAGIQKDV